MSDGQNETKRRIDKAVVDLNNALENLSTLRKASNPKSGEVIWSVASNILINIHKVSGGIVPPEKIEKYLAVIESDVRLLDTLYHSTPQNWRRAIKERPQSESVPFSTGTTWQKYRDLIVTSAITAAVTAIVTALIFRLI